MDLSLLNGQASVLERDHAAKALLYPLKLKEHSFGRCKISLHWARICMLESMLHFEWSSFISAPVEEVFAFHERSDALELLTPPSERVTVIRRDGSIKAGSVVELKVGLGPFSTRWIAEHTVYEKDRLFIDEQRSGPFAFWRHQHRFLPEDDGTRLVDSIDFALYGGPVAEKLAGWLIVRRLRAMFTYRHDKTRQELRR